MTQKRQILLQNALALLCEAQRRASALKDDTHEEIRDLMHKVSHQAKEGAVHLVHYWHENKEHLPPKMASEVDRLLNKIGLVMVSKAKKASAKKPAPKKAAPKKSATPAAAKKASAKKPAPKKAAAKKAPTPAPVSAA